MKTLFGGLTLCALLSLLTTTNAHAADCSTPDKAATAISKGHAFGKHVTKGKEFEQGKKMNNLAFAPSSITTEDQFKNFLQGIISTSTTSKVLDTNRTAYWDTATGTIVIVNKKAPDCGTAFRPTKGKKYYDSQK